VLKVLKPTWVWFDLDDTLHDLSHALHAAVVPTLNKIVTRTHLPLEEVMQNFERIYAAQRQAEFADGRASHDYRRERFGGAMEGSAITEAEKQAFVDEVVGEYEQQYISSLKLKSHVLEVIEALEEKGCKLAILTDGSEDGQNRVVEKLGIRSHFEAVFTAGQYRASKAQGLMRIVLDKFRLSPSEVTMVGDSLQSDILPALELDIRPVWLNEKGLANEHRICEIQSLAQLPGVLF
jgi:putative hydrolase of the HAD superfamily